VDLAEAKRIAVVGNSGAGKSTLSKMLGKHLGIDVFPIDKIYWLPGWKLRDQKSYKLKHDSWLSRESWIIEGVGYWDEMKERISKSDIVIFLDVPTDLCKKRAEDRITEERLAPNPNITEGCIYGEVKDRQMEVIEYFHNSTRPKLLKLLSNLNHVNVKIINAYSELAIENET
jgi:adenylate kinase family enzyme